MKIKLVLVKIELVTCENRIGPCEIRFDHYENRIESSEIRFDLYENWIGLCENRIIDHCIIETISCLSV